MAGAKIVRMDPFAVEECLSALIAGDENELRRQLVGGRSYVASSDCLCASTKRMCPTGIWMRVDMFP